MQAEQINELLNNKDFAYLRQYYSEEELRKKLEKSKLNPTQFNSLYADGFGVVSLYIDQASSTLGNTKAAKAFRLITNTDLSDNQIERALNQPEFAPAKQELQHLREIITNQVTVTREQAYEVEGHNFVHRDRKQAIPHIISTSGNCDTQTVNEVQTFTKDLMVKVADKLAPAPQNAALPAQREAAVVDNSWTENAEDDAEAVLLVDFGNNHNDEESAPSYASREAQINADYILALQEQMIEIALFMQQPQVQSFFVLYINVVIARELTRQIIQDIQWQGMAGAANFADIYGMHTSTNRRSETCHQAAQHENDNTLDQTFRALPPTFTV